MSNSTQRTVVITGVGAERGIGRATAHRFAKDGWAVAGLDLDADASAKLAAELTEQYGVPAYGGPVNVADEESVLAARDAVHAADLPTVGAVLNIAGITSPVPFLETTLDLWNKIFAVNATGTYLVTKAFLPDMIDGGYGRIVNIASDAGRVGSSGESVYAGAKGAVIAFGKTIAREVATKGVTVNSVCPGPTRTPMLESMGPNLIGALERAVPMKRLGEPTDVAAAVAFLASEEAGYITGQTLSVSGGLTMA
jgi:NAD(P)-dependent dehydrogenase (short-subunit alcohol dehydrogenase family)